MQLFLGIDNGASSIPLPDPANPAAPQLMAGIEIVWGNETTLEHAPPTQMTVSVLFPSPAAEIENFKRGTEVELYYNDRGQSFRTIFAGRIREMTARRHGKNGLIITATCTDFTAELESSFVASQNLTTDSDGANRMAWIANQINTQRNFQVIYDPADLSRITTQGFIPALTMKATTFIDRLISSDPDLTRWDASYMQYDTTLEKLVMLRRVRVAKRGQPVNADTLTVNPDGTWVAGGTESLPGLAVVLPGAFVADDIQWKDSPDGQVSEVRVTWDRLRHNDATNTWEAVETERIVRDTAIAAAYGDSSVEIRINAEVEWTDQTDAQYLSEQISRVEWIAKRWHREQPGWQIDALTVINSDQLDPDALGNLLDAYYRPTVWILQTENTRIKPYDSPFSIRGALIGGTYIWDGKKWGMTLTLGSAPSITAPANPWKFSDLTTAAAPIPSTTAATVGAAITFADFQSITRT